MKQKNIDFSKFLNIKYIFILLILILILLEIVCYTNNKTFHEILNPNDYDILFNEEKYAPKNVDIKLYNETVNNGFNVMKKTKLVIGGLFQNSAHVFEKLKKRLNNLSNYFYDIQIVIFENDSHDNSRLLLLNWENEQDNVHIIKCKENNYCLLKTVTAKDHGSLSEGRMKKMINYRNIVKKYIDLNFSNYDYFMVLDTDTSGFFSLNGLAYSFGTNKHWDAISSYGLVGLVFTFGNLIYYDLISLSNNLDPFFTLELLKTYVYVNSKHSDLIPIKQAFGGLTIYKMSSVKNADYSPRNNCNKCEHTVLLDNMRSNGYDKFYINPHLIFLVGHQGKDIFGIY
jgi:hypothetical protein